MFDLNLVNNTYSDLAQRVKDDLDEQFSRGRIKGTDYANVYSNLMNTILQLSFQTPEQSAQIDNIMEDTKVKQKQEGLIDAQTKNTLEDVNVKLKQEGLIEAQTNDTLEDIKVKQKQEDLIAAQTGNTLEDTNLKLKQEDLTTAQTHNVDQDTTLKQTQGALYDAQTKVALRQERSYNDSLRLKLFKAQMDSWGIMLSSGMLDPGNENWNVVPDVIRSDKASEVYNEIAGSIHE